MSSSPELDVASLLLPRNDATLPDDAMTTSCGKNIIQNLKQYGYVVLRNTGLRRSENYHAHLDAMQEFIKLPRATKKSASLGAYFGYRGTKLDEMEKSAEGEDVGLVESVAFNPTDTVPYPPRTPSYRSVFQQYYKDCHALAFRLIECLSLALGKDRTFLRRFFDDQDFITLRSSFYEAVGDTALPPRFTRYAAHTDFMLMSLILPDEVGGLQIMNPTTGEWEEPAVDEDTVLLIPGDVMQCWLNNQVKALLHRVVLPSDNRRFKTRKSFIFFVAPSQAASLQPLDGSHNPELKFSTYRDLCDYRFSFAHNRKYAGSTIIRY